MGDEKHKEGGKYLKPFVYGGMDGIITTFAVVTGAAGANLDPTVAIILGVANMVADGMSMGLGDFLSEKSEQAYIRKERSREEWETENYLEGEKREMVEIYEGKGMSTEDANKFIDIISEYKDLFVDLMLVEELGLMPIDEDDPYLAAKSGMVTFLSFQMFGIIPLIVYIVAVVADLNSHVQVHDTFSFIFIISCIMTLLALFALGSVKSKFTDEKWYIGGTITTVYGALAATVSFGIGFILELILVG